MIPSNGLHLQSEMMVLKLLRRIHSGAGETALYQSAPKVAASARQATNFQVAARTADISIQPLLSYYALLHWMKTVLYLHDLNYPPSSSVLQHGLSLRRSKRHTYRWPLEALHVYKEGVLQSYAELTGLTRPLPARFIVGDVVGSLPRICNTVGGMYPPFQHLYSFKGSRLSNSQSNGHVSRRIASNLGLTVEEWLHVFSRNTERDSAWHALHATVSGSSPNGMLSIQLPPRHHPWVIEHQNETFVYDSDPWPSWLLHFVILYTLSSLCRYNPTEWSDVLTWSNETDAVLVREYIETFSVDSVCRMVTDLSTTCGYIGTFHNSVHKAGGLDGTH
jgi:hypothetical protein